MTVYLVRHGESLANLHKDLPLQEGFATITDDLVPLSRWGYEQAVEAGKFLADDLREAVQSGRKIKLIYSPFQRTAHTTRGILRQLNTSNLIAVMDDNLREQHFGLFSCITDRELIGRLWPEQNARFVNDRADPNRVHEAKPPGGESRDDVEKRVRELIKCHQADFEDPNTDIILVGHGLVNRTVEMCLCGKNQQWLNEQKNPHNCTIRKLEGNLGNGYALAQTVHEGKARPNTLPPQYKTEPHGGELAIAR